MIRWRIVLIGKTLIVEAVFFITQKNRSLRKELYEVNEQDVSRLFSQTSGEHSREVTVNDLELSIRELISDPRNNDANDTNDPTEDQEVKNVFFIAKNDASGDPELYQMKDDDVATLSPMILQLRQEAEKVPASDLLLLINALAGDSNASNNLQGGSAPQEIQFKEENYNGFPPPDGYPLKQEPMKNEVEEEEDGEWEQIEEIEEEEEVPGGQFQGNPPYQMNQGIEYNRPPAPYMYPTPMDRPPQFNQPMSNDNKIMDSTEVLLCFLCNFKTAEPDALKQHYSTKHGESGEESGPTPMQEQNVYKEQEMPQAQPPVPEIKNEDPPERKVTGTACPDCEYVAGNNNRLLRHIKGVHDKIRDNRCTYPNCDYATSYKFQLTRHMQSQHGQEPPSGPPPENRPPMGNNYPPQMPHPMEMQRLPMQPNFDGNNYGNAGPLIQRGVENRPPMVNNYPPQIQRPPMEMQRPPMQPNFGGNNYGNAGPPIPNRSYFASEPIPREQLDESYFPVKQESAPFNNRFKQEIKNEFKQEQMNNYEMQMEEEKYEPPITKTCLHCSYKTDSRVSMHEHVKIYHGKNLSVKCQTTFKCRYQTWNKSYLERHVSTVHSNNKNLSCLHCNYTTFTYPSLQVHSLTRHIRPIYVKSKPMTCSQCFYQTMSLTSLKGHLKTHEQKQTHKCKTCDFKCSDPILLKKHSKVNHAPVEVLLCFLCNFKTSKKVLLAEHYIMQHGPPPNKIISPHISKKQSYDYERRQFENQSIPPMPMPPMTPMNDMNGDGGDGQRFPCNQCSYAPNRRSYLLRHQREVHEGVKAFSCELCDYKTARNRDLQTHLRTKHGGESLVGPPGMGDGFNCSMCPFTSNNEQALVQHRNDVHGVLKGVSCDQCDYVAGNPGRLQLHIKGVHDQNRDQVCDYPGCDYATSYKSGLVRHFKTVHSIEGQEAIDRANRLDVMNNSPGLSEAQRQAQLMAKPVNVHGPAIPKQEMPRAPPEQPVQSNSPSFINQNPNGNLEEQRDFSSQPVFEQGTPGGYNEMDGNNNISMQMDGRYYDSKEGILNMKRDMENNFAVPPSQQEMDENQAYPEQISYADNDEQMPNSFMNETPYATTEE